MQLESTNRLEVTPGMLDHGQVRIGVLATMMDVAGAGLAIEAVRPDWIATSDLGIHITRPVTAGTMTFVCRPLRTGARSSVIETEVTDDDGNICGLGRMSFARIPGKATTAAATDPVGADPVEFAMEGGSPLVRPITDLCGFVPVGPGQLRFDKADYVRNSFGTVNGGVLALAAEAAAVSAAGDGWASDLHIHYLEQIGDGPVAATAEVARSDRDGDYCSVRIQDRSTGRLCAVSDIRVARPERH